MATPTEEVREMSNRREEEIRAIARRIWQETGHPSDQADLHWEMAVKEVEEAEREEDGHGNEKGASIESKNKSVV